MVAKTGDNMTGDLDMGGSQRVINLIDPVRAQDAATKKYVDTLMVKRMIVGALISSSISFHLVMDPRDLVVVSDYPIITPGRIVRSGLVAKTREGLNSGRFIVCVVVDGKAKRDYKVAKPEGKPSAVTIFRQPLDVRVGSIINFMSTRTDAEAVAVVVSLLFELYT